MKTEHGYPIVESYQIENNRYLVRIVREGNLHNHVVWNMTADGKCSEGSYFSTEDEAKAGFTRRRSFYQ